MIFLTHEAIVLLKNKNKKKTMAATEILIKRDPYVAYTYDETLMVQTVELWIRVKIDWIQIQP